MSSIFNRKIKQAECSFCNGDMWMRTDKNEIIQVDGVDQRCSCYYTTRYLDSNIGYDYWFITPETWRGSPEDLQKVTKYFPSVSKFLQEGRGFYIYGPYGTGKTSLALLYLKHVIGISRCTCLFVPFSELVVINSKIMTGWHDKEIEQAIEDVKNVDFLVLDDLAKEYDNAKDNGRATLNAILRYRDLWRKPTIYTANIPIEETAEKYGGSSHSIIQGKSIIVNMENTEDFRHLRKIEQEFEDGD
jgi:DNA replication protein DnaC